MKFTNEWLKYCWEYDKHLVLNPGARWAVWQEMIRDKHCHLQNMAKKGQL